MSDKYRELFADCSEKLEKMSSSTLESNVAKGLGTAGKAVGKFIGNIPFIKEGPVDEFLQDTGENLQRDAEKLEKKAVKAFATIANPETGLFVEKMEDLVKIYNNTNRICFDKDNIYLIAN